MSVVGWFCRLVGCQEIRKATASLRPLRLCVKNAFHTFTFLLRRIFIPFLNHARKNFLHHSR